ncbi:MAG: PQQ-like beta-propeller repeat protein [Holosporales bacterium]|jgi:outer membrane protein assembly factor BamB|nr:PQQ-like beta-propeller repeat protein [Holosporales bacterium]
MMMRNYFILFCAALLLMTACDKKEILPGKREPISGIPLKSDSRGSIDSDLRARSVQLPAATSVSSFVDVMGNKQHVAINYRLSQKPKILWDTSIGRGPVSSDIIAYNGFLYAVDATGELSCVSQKDGRISWSKTIAKQPDESSFAGGLTANGGVIYISTNIGHVIAIDTKTHKELWNINLKFPVKGAPLYVSDKLIVTAVNNQTFALNPKNGETLWSKTMTQEQTVMCGTSIAAVSGDTLICAYSSGDIIAINVRDGSDIWADVLFSANIAESGFVISHIAASPAVLDGFVLASTSESKTAMIDVVSGIRRWEQSFGTTLTPAVVRDWAFMLSNDNTLFCISLKTGNIKWTTDVRNLSDDECSKKNKVKWVGPILINGNVTVFSEDGDVAYFDASTGALKKKDTFPKVSFTRTPIIVDGVMFAVSERGSLYAIG